MKKVFVYICLGIAIIAVVGYYGIGAINNAKEEKKRQKISQKQELKLKQAITDMVSKHNAITKWKSGLVYTSQIQDVLLSTNGRPVYLSGTITDIQKSHNNYILYLTASEISYELVITPEQYRKIIDITNATDKKHSIGTALGVVAIIRQVTKPAFSVDAEAESPDEASVIINSSGILIKGDCIDFSEEDFISSLKERMIP
jgi:hypothetical protein